MFFIEEKNSVTHGSGVVFQLLDFPFPALPIRQTPAAEPLSQIPQEEH